jgi:hypothetical protein
VHITYPSVAKRPQRTSSGKTRGEGEGAEILHPTLANCGQVLEFGFGCGPSLVTMRSRRPGPWREDVVSGQERPRMINHFFLKAEGGDARCAIVDERRDPCGAKVASPGL